MVTNFDYSKYCIHFLSQSLFTIFDSCKVHLTLELPLITQNLTCASEYCRRPSLSTFNVGFDCVLQEISNSCLVVSSSSFSSHILLIFIKHSNHLTSLLHLMRKYLKQKTASHPSVPSPLNHFRCFILAHSKSN